MSEINRYGNASIYTIRNYKDDSLIYVGSTISPIHKRLCSHKANCRNGRSGSLYNHIIDNDWSDWYLELYERFPCNDRAELCKREGEVIREIGTINKQIAGRTAKEWYGDNRDKHLENCKNWQANNRTKYSEYMKLYMREYNTRKRSATP
jgi:hypothetical protein